MKPFYLILAFITFQITSQAQQKYTIHGKVTRLTKSDSIHIGDSKAKINADGSFDITGETRAAQMVYLRTDSSRDDGLWLEAGNYTLHCEEFFWQTGDKTPAIRIMVIAGPASAKMLSDFQTQLFAIMTSQGREGLRKRVDSIFRACPNSGILDQIVRAAYHNIDDSATARFISLLTNDQRNSGVIPSIESEIKQTAKIDKEQYFEDFSMPTSRGGTFKLSSLQGKVVLIDFWATGCAPCRARHPKMIALYNKYKSQGLEMVGVSLDNNNDEWQASIEKDKIQDWINVSELNGFANSLVQDYFIIFIPYHFLIGRDRKVIRVYPAGGESEADIVAALAAKDPGK